MRENVRKFLELLETDAALKQQAEELGRKEKEGIDGLITLAAAHHIFLTEEDFRLEEKGEISDEELDAVSGGTAGKTVPMDCVCALAGNGGLCSCISSGQGSNGWACTCQVGGYGSAAEE